MRYTDQIALDFKTDNEIGRVNRPLNVLKSFVHDRVDLQFLLCSKRIHCWGLRRMGVCSPQVQTVSVIGNKNIH